MRRFVRIPVVCLLVTATAVGWLQAETSAQAQKWLDKLKTTTEASAFSVDYTAHTSSAQAGQPGVDMQGSMTRAGTKHLRMKLELKMDMGGTPMTMDMLGVSDGEQMWMDLTSPLAGGRQILKIPVDRLSELSNVAPGMGLGGSSGGIDPISAISDMSSMFDLDLAGVDAGRVTLTAEMSEDARAKMEQAGAGEEPPTGFTLVLDEKTGLPLEMRVGGDDPSMLLRFTNLKLLDREAIAPETFTYTAPEGVQVMDLGAMLNAGAAAGGQP